MTNNSKLFINGQWKEGADGETFEVINPATEEVINHVCVASARDLEEALRAVDNGFKVWKAMAPQERAKLMHKSAQLMRERIDDMAKALTLEQGKTLAQSKFELLITAHYFDDLADCGVRVAGKVLPPESSGVVRSMVYEPIGPVYAVSPWNLPAMMPGRKIANALAAGCSVVVKPAEETPLTAYHIAKCCQDAGIPDGVLNVVCGDPSQISNTLISSPVIRKVSFTGSTRVGKILAQLAGTHMKKVTMELGGHAPVIICQDANVEEVVNMTVPARYSNAGQSCMAATRFFVHDSIYDDFVTAFTEKVQDIKLGYGMDKDVDMGPLTNERRLKVMEELVEDARNKGAHITCGGRRLPQKGYYFEPTVLSEVTDEANIMTEEPFGPITPITRFHTLDEVIVRANSTPYGLASYVFTHDLDRSNKLSESLQAGLVGINCMNVAGPAVPFGGVKDSGIGREGALEGVLESMITKTVSIGS